MTINQAQPDSGDESMLFHKPCRWAAGALLAAVAVVGSANAASLTSSGYFENFDSMGTSGTAPPLDWTVYTGPSGTTNATWTTTIPGSGVAAMVAAPTPLTAATTPTTTNNNSFNAASSSSSSSSSSASDRVLATSPTTVSGAGLQVMLTNNTGAALSGVNVSFDTVRFNSVTTTNELPGYWLFYSLDGLSWNNVASLNPTLATIPSTMGVTAATGSVAFASAVAAGANFYLRWIDDNANQTSPDQIIGLNNVSVSTVPPPAAAWLLLSGLGSLGLVRRKHHDGKSNGHHSVGGLTYAPA